MDPQTPLSVATYVVGLVLAVPTLIVLIRLIYFAATANAKLDQCVEGLKQLVDFKHATRNTLQTHEMRITIAERDIEQLKEGTA